MNYPKPTGNLVIDLRRVTDLGAYPVTLTEAKTQCRVDFTDDDTELTALIRRATRMVENYCNISIVYQRVRIVAALESFFSLPYPPVIGIESVEDNSGTSEGSGPVTYATSTDNWSIDGDVFGPESCYRRRITYTAGMDSCPDDLKQVILQVLAFMYENKGKDVSVEDVQHVLRNADYYKVLLWT